MDQSDLTVEQAADMLSTTTDAVARLLRDGELLGYEKDGRQLIPRDQVVQRMVEQGNLAAPQPVTEESAIQPE